MPVSRKYRLLFFISVHILVWATLFCFPFFNVSETPSLELVIRRSWLPLGFCAIIFYLNYFLVVDRLFFREKILIFLVVNLLLIIIIIWMNELVRAQLPTPIRAVSQDPESTRRMLRIKEIAWYSRMTSFVLSVVLSVALKVTGRWKKIEAEKEKSEKMRLQSELTHLKYQLQPHFFFNSLNNIYSLIDQSPDLAKKAVHSMGKLMRYLLYETDHEKVSLETEVDFLRKYIELMQLRLTPNNHVRYEFPDNGSSYQVAPLLFIPLIENAFKHGVGTSIGSSIYFKMEVHDRELLFTTENPDLPKNESDKSGSGIGLDNLKKRLELVYPGRHIFNTRKEGGLFKTTLIIIL